MVLWLGVALLIGFSAVSAASVPHGNAEVKGEIVRSHTFTFDGAAPPETGVQLRLLRVDTESTEPPVMAAIHLKQDALQATERAGQWLISEAAMQPLLTAQAFLPAGAYDLHLVLPEVDAEPVVLDHWEVESARNPEPARVVIQPHQGKPGIWINDTPRFPFAYLPHAGDFDKQYTQMRDVGVELFSLYAPIGNHADGFNDSHLDEPFLRLLKHHPDAYIFPRVDVGPPGWWLEAHPEERYVYDNGEMGPQSMFSEAWMAAAEEWVEAYSRYIRTGPYADRIMGIHLCTGHTGEWQSWGLWEDLRGDFSEPAQRAWRDYLVTKYGSEAAWQKAWGERAEGNLDEAVIPSRERREQDSDTLQRAPVAYQDVIDFYDFYWRGTVEAIERLARAAKVGGGENWLVGVFYGYQIQYGGLAQESQHLGMQQLMDCPDIDFFCSPAMYSQRAPGGTSTFMSFTESIQQRGKLWWDEADNRTHLVDHPEFGPVNPAADLWESLNVLQREFAHNIMRQTAVWWFDMSGGWYDDPALLDLFRQMREFGEAHEAAWRPEVEVAVFLDDKSLYRMPPAQRYLNLIPPFLSDMPRLGAPYNTYLLADLDKAPEYTAYIFLNAFDLSAEERAAINALKRDGKTLLFIGPAGNGAWEDGRVTPAPQGAWHGLVGFTPEGTDGLQSYVHPEWRAAWLETPEISMAELRAFLGNAPDHIDAVHIYHEADDALYLGNGFVALHAQHAGEKTLQFETPMRFRELFTDTPLETEGATLEFPLNARETRSFVIEPVP